MHISPVLSPFVFIRSVFSSTENFIPNIVQFSYARGALVGAIESIIHHYNIERKPTVWAPGFICDTVTYLLELYDLDIKYYPITEELEPDFEKMKLLSFDAEDILLFVHYFGFEMKTKGIIDFCRDNKLHLIEDCAHSIVPKIQDGGIGTYGDAAIFGLRKALPLPHGGFLFMKDIKYCPPKNISTNSGIYRSTFKMMVQWVFHKLKINYTKNIQSIDKNIIPTQPENYSVFDFQEGMDSISRKITNTVDISEIVKKRITNYKYYEDNLLSFSEITVPSSFRIKEEQTTPWVFFFYFHEAEKLINFLRSCAIPASDFPALPPEVFNNHKYELENNLYRKSVTLPVHQDLDRNDLDFIISKIKEFLSK